MIEPGNLQRTLQMHLNFYKNFIVVTLTNQAQVHALRLVELVVKGGDNVMNKSPVLIFKPLTSQ